MEVMREIIVAIAVIVVFISISVINIIPMLNERKYIKMEMQRAGSEREYAHWRKVLRVFYMQHIPIVRWFFR